MRSLTVTISILTGLFAGVTAVIGLIAYPILEPAWVLTGLK